MERKEIYEEGFFVEENDDEYHEDELPDLVLDAHQSRYSSCNEMASRRRRLSSSAASDLDNFHDDDSSSSSIIDLLLTSLATMPRSVSTSDLFEATSATSIEVDDCTEEEVHAERGSNEKDYRVTYMNHRKSYAAPSTVGAGTYDVYKSYLSLFPQESGELSNSGTDTTAEKLRKRQEETEKILSQFRSLTSAQQQEQRKAWSEELNLVEEEMKRLRYQLKEKVKRRSLLRRLIGVSKVEAFLRTNFHQVEQKLNDITEKTSQNLSTALVATASHANAIQRVAKKSVDHLTQEIRDFVTSGLSVDPYSNRKSSDTCQLTTEELRKTFLSSDQNSNNLPHSDLDSATVTEPTIETKSLTK